MATRGEAGERIDIGRVISRGFATLRRHALPFAGLAFLLSALPVFLMYYLLLGSLDPEAPAEALRSIFSPRYGVTVFVTVVTGYLLQAALVRSSILDQSGRPIEIGKSLTVALRLLLPMIGLVILSSILIGLGLLLFVVPGIILYIMWIVAVPAMVEERKGIISSMRRSRTLTKGSRWRIFALLLLFLFAYFGISALLEFLLTVAVPRTVVLAAMASALTSATSALLVAVMLAALYLELRTVKEGATSESLAAIFE